MKVYTAEASDGRIYLIRGSIDAGEAAKRAFADDALALLRTNPEDESTARELELYEWPDEQEAGVWLAGTPTGSRSWTEMGKAARYGSIEYVYPGDWVILLDTVPA